MKGYKSLILAIFLISVSCNPSKKLNTNYHQISPLNADMTVNMVIEIPTGTTAKYELNKSSYTLELDSIDNQPRYIDYLGYPGNYGMIPNTILLKEKGGDGDPLDILLLGPAIHRGSVVKVRIIGILQLMDNGEQDDKLIAIQPDTKWEKVKHLEDLDIYYPGSRTIISTFFQNYKGEDKMKIIGWSDASKAFELLEISLHKNISN